MATDSGPGAGLGPRLRLVRESRGVSARELARRVGCSASLVSQVERGLSMPSVGVLYAVASELDCSLDYLLFGTGGTGPGGTGGTGAGGIGGTGAGGIGGTGAGGIGEAAASPGGGAPKGDVPAAPEAFRGEAPVLARPATASTRARRSDGVVLRGCDRRVIDLASGVRWERLTPAADELTDFLKVIYSPGGHSTDERRPLRHEGREYGLILSGTLRANVGFETYELSPGDSIVFDSSTPHEYWNTTGDYVHAVWVVVHTGRTHP